MQRLNLSEWAITHRALVLFMIMLLGAAGAYSYFNLGRAEDPSFTIKVMVVNVAWPGATATEMQAQVADKIEKKLQELPFLDRVESYSQPGVSFIRVILSDRTPPAKVKDLWYQVRKKVGDIRGSLPGRDHRPELQRRVRRRLFGALHAHRRRPDACRAQGARRGHPPAPAARAGRQQGRHHRRAAQSASSSSSATPSSRRSASRRSRSSTASPSRTPSWPAARSIPRPTASTCASPAPSPASRRSPPCRCRPTAACSGSATSRPSSAATRIRRASSSAPAASRRSASASRCRTAPTSSRSART